MEKTLTLESYYISIITITIIFQNDYYKSTEFY